MRPRYLLLAMSGVVVASSACSTDATAPLPLAAPESASSWRSQSRYHDSDRDDADGEYAFRIDPRRDNYLTFGKHSLWLPAYSVCDPATSGYGMGTWNLPCSPLSGRITITARVRSSAHGLPRVNLEPEIRFNPRHDVILSFFVRGKQAKDAADMRILYCPTNSAKDCVDEAQADPSLGTVLDERGRRVFRRIKHFSGYLVAERNVEENAELY